MFHHTSHGSLLACSVEAHNPKDSFERLRTTEERDEMSPAVLPIRDAEEVTGRNESETVRNQQSLLSIRHSVLSHEVSFRVEFHDSRVAIAIGNVDARSVIRHGDVSWFTEVRSITARRERLAQRQHQAMLCIFEDLQRTAK